MEKKCYIKLGQIFSLGFLLKPKKEQFLFQRGVSRLESCLTGAACCHLSHSMDSSDPWSDKGYLFRAERGEGEKYGRKEDSRRIRLLAEVRSSQILIAKGNFASLVLTVPWRNPTTETCPASGAPCSLFTYICQIRRKQIRPLFHACLTGRIEASRVSM